MIQLNMLALQKAVLPGFTIRQRVDLNNVIEVRHRSGDVRLVPVGCVQKGAQFAIDALTRTMTDILRDWNPA